MLASPTDKENAMSQEPNSPAALLAECRAALDEMERIDKAATPGPWVALREEPLTIKDNSGATSDAADVCYINEEKEDWALPGRPKDNAAVLAVSRSIFPSVLAYLRTRVDHIEKSVKLSTNNTRSLLEQAIRADIAERELRQIHALLTGGSNGPQ